MHLRTKTVLHQWEWKPLGFLHLWVKRGWEFMNMEPFLATEFTKYCRWMRKYDRITSLQSMWYGSPCALLVGKNLHPWDGLSCHYTQIDFEYPKSKTQVIQPLRESHCVVMLQTLKRWSHSTNTLRLTHYSQNLAFCCILCLGVISYCILAWIVTMWYVYSNHWLFVFLLPFREKQYS